MRRKVLAVVALAMICAETAVLVRRRGRLFAADTAVRCHRGHLFTTLWIPGGSLKAVRLGWWRIQRCPVGHHWALVTPVTVSALTDEEREFAAHHYDVRIP